MKKAVCGIRPLLIYGIQYSSFSTWKRRLRHKNRCFEKLTLFSNARLQFYSNNYVLSTSQIVDARVIALENGDVIELNDDCYNIIITKMCDLGSYDNVTEKIIELEEKEAEEVEVAEEDRINTRPRRQTRAPAYHEEMMKWN